VVRSDEKLIALLESVAKGEIDVVTATDVGRDEVMAKIRSMGITNMREAA
jgi:hypothetical protein